MHQGQLVPIQPPYPKIGKLPEVPCIFVCPDTELQGDSQGGKILLMME